MTTQIAALSLPFVIPAANRWLHNSTWLDLTCIAAAGFLGADLLLHPTLFQLPADFGLPWLNPNSAAIGLVLLTTALPRQLTFAARPVQRVWIQAVALIPLSATESVFAVGLLLVAMLTMYRTPHPTNTRYPAYVAVAVCGLLARDHIARSLEVRAEIWRISLGIIGEHPLRGVQVDGFPSAFAAARSAAFIVLKGDRTFELDPHNLVLNLLVSFGMPLGLALLCAMALLLTRHWRNVVHAQYEHGVALGMFVVQSMVSVNSAAVAAIIGTLALRARVIDQGQRALSQTGE